MIVGLDLATRCTGYAYGTGAERPRVGAWHYDYVGQDLGLLLSDYHNDLSTLPTPTVIMYESPMLTPRDRLLPLRKIYAMGAYTELWARQRGVLIEETSAISLKKLLCGHHKASKDDMVAMSLTLGIVLPEGEARKDAADAFAAWLRGVQCHAKEHQPRWDRALYSPRGRLDL